MAQYWNFGSKDLTVIISLKDGNESRQNMNTAVEWIEAKLHWIAWMNRPFLLRVQFTYLQSIFFWSVYNGAMCLRSIMIRGETDTSRLLFTYNTEYTIKSKHIHKAYIILHVYLYSTYMFYEITESLVGRHV